MVWQQVPEDSAGRCLQGGALGVADHHTDSLPRDFTIRLIRDGLVRILFLECISTAEEELYTAAVQLTDLPDDVYEEKIAEIVDKAGPRPYYNDVTLGEVAAFALRNRVSVQFIDLDIPGKTSPGTPAKRDKHAAERFTEITAQNGGPAGCLVLFGGAHFIGGTDTYRGGGRCLGELLELSYVLMPWFEISHDYAQTKYSFRLCGDKGEAIAAGNSYPTRAEAVAAIKAVKRAAAKAQVPK